MEATFGSCPLADASSCALAWDSGLWWSPGVPRLPGYMWQFLFCRCSRVCSNVAP